MPSSSETGPGPTVRPSIRAMRRVCGVDGLTETAVDARTTNAPFPGTSETGFGTTASGTRRRPPARLRPE